MKNQDNHHNKIINDRIIYKIYSIPVYNYMSIINVPYYIYHLPILHVGVIMIELVLMLMLVVVKNSNNVAITITMTNATEVEAVVWEYHHHHQNHHQNHHQ